MFKLTVIAGPLRGTSFPLGEGDTSLGRVTGNEVVIQSTKVSKRHCVFSQTSNGILVKDVGSSNGTFVNGTLISSKLLKSGDRVSVGDCVLELTKVAEQKMAVGSSIGIPVGASIPNMSVGQSKVIPFPTQGQIGGLNNTMSGTGTGVPQAPAPPKDLVEKAKFYFEKYVINFLYTLNEKQQWSFLVKALIGVLVVFTAAISTYPMLDKCQNILLIEAKNRAQALARLMVDRNTTALLEKAETRLDIGFAERENGILGAYLVELEGGRIMAPGKKLNQILTDQEGRFANKARTHFTKVNNSERGEATYFSMPAWKSDGSIDPTLPILDGNMMGYAEPVKVLDPRSNRNVVVAMAIVILDLNRILIDDVTGFIMFLSSVVLGAILAAGVYVSIHRLTTRPVDHLNKEIDRALRGEIQSVENPYKMEELNEFINVLNLAIQKASANGGSAGASNAFENPDDFLNPMKFTAQRASSPMMVLDADKKVAALSPAMEELTGIRSDGAVGNSIEVAVPDQAFVLMLNDLIAKAPIGVAEGVTDSLEFSGVNYTIDAIGLGNPLGSTAKGYVIALKQAG